MPHFAAFVFNTSSGGGVTSVNGQTGAVVLPGVTFTVASSAPGSPSNGDRWLDTDTGIMYEWVSSESFWIEL
jgi:hypothetical protein